MKKRFHKLALFIGAASLAGAGLIVACSSDSAPVATPGVDAAKADSGGNPDTSPNPTPDGGQDSGADADCTKDPILRDYTTGYRCAFVDAGGVEGGTNCTNGQTCCETNDKVGAAFQPSYCTTTPTKGDGNANCKAGAAAAGSSFDAGNAWECADKSACVGAPGPVCCVIQDPVRLAMDPVKNKLNIGNTPATDKNHPPACGVKRVFNEGGSRCKTACASPEFQLCSLSDMNCGAGTVCTPFVDFQGTARGYCK